MVATPGLLLLQVPPVAPLDVYVVVALGQSDVGPVIVPALGSGLMVIVAVPVPADEA
jgi:hypothetical protein